MKEACVIKKNWICLYLIFVLVILPMFSSNTINAKTVRLAKIDPSYDIHLDHVLCIDNENSSIKEAVLDDTIRNGINYKNEILDLDMSESRSSCIDNRPPNPPIVIGPSYGKVGEIYTYKITVSDPDEEQGLVRLELDFGDELVVEDAGCCGAVWKNGQILNISHIWSDPGDYRITARVMDIYLEWSNWSDPLEVRMPRNPLVSHLSFIKQCNPLGFAFLACFIREYH